LSDHNLPGLGITMYE
ncbi:hypothetical protein MPER_06156, partial [Moniliophthora perniciosa FA553]